MEDSVIESIKSESEDESCKEDNKENIAKNNNNTNGSCNSKPILINNNSGKNYSN